MSEQQLPPPPPISVPPPPPPAQPARQGSKLVPIIVLAVIFGFLGVVLYMTKDAGSADDLKAGECFDRPTSSSFSTVNKRACTEPHDAEVFHVAEIDSDASTPVSITIEGFVDDECVPAFEAYVGASLDDSPDLGLGYFYPDFDGWADGDRTITCYVDRTDQAKLSESLKGSAGS